MITNSLELKELLKDNNEFEHEVFIGIVNHKSDKGSKKKLKLSSN